MRFSISYIVRDALRLRAAGATCIQFLRLKTARSRRLLGIAGGIAFPRNRSRAAANNVAERKKFTREGTTSATSVDVKEIPPDPIAFTTRRPINYFHEFSSPKVFPRRFFAKPHPPTTRRDATDQDDVRQPRTTLLRRLFALFLL